MSAGNMEKVLRLMADKGASDIYLSANTRDPDPHQWPDPATVRPDPGADADSPAARRIADTAPARGVRRRRRIEPGRQPGRHRQLPPLGLPPARHHGRGHPLHPVRHSGARFARPAAAAVDAGAGKARPDPDGRRHRHRQEHDPGGDARMAQPAGHRPHPDHRRPDRVPVQQQEVGHQPARGRARHRVAADRAEERAAPGARLHPDRRDPRPRDDDLGDLVRAVGPPGAGHAARQQQLPRDGAHPVVLFARGASGVARPTWPPACAR